MGGGAEPLAAAAACRCASQVGQVLRPVGAVVILEAKELLVQVGQVNRAERSRPRQRDRVLLAHLAELQRGEVDFGVSEPALEVRRNPVGGREALHAVHALAAAKPHAHDVLVHTLDPGQLGGLQAVGLAVAAHARGCWDQASVRDAYV